jgi:hypothetical protein
VEPGRDGRDGWVGGALSVRYDLVRWLSVAARGDVLHVSSGGGQNMFFSDYLEDGNGDATLQSTTLTLDLHPVRRVSIRLEGRHDRTNFPLFYRDLVRTVPMGGPRDFVANDSNQTTVTVGMTAWF